MKYCNKNKKYRLTWTTTKPPAIYKIASAKRWCQLNASPNKFYFHYTNTKWWFENAEDAVAFSLIWSYFK